MKMKTQILLTKVIMTVMILIQKDDDDVGGDDDEDDDDNDLSSETKSLSSPYGWTASTITAWHQCSMLGLFEED